MAVLQRKFQRPASFGLVKIWEEGVRISEQGRQNALTRHLSAALHGMWRAPFTSFVTILTIAVVFFVVGAALLCVENISHYLQTTSSQISFSVYLKENVSEAEVSDVRKVLEALPHVREVRFLSKSQALEEFRGVLGNDASVLQGLDTHNPLPASFEVTFQEQSRELFESSKERLKGISTIEQIQFNETLMRQLADTIESLRTNGMVAISIILFLAACIIGNTLTLSLYAHREEIEIMRLVGARRSFIRAPYLLEGVLQGGVGSLLGILALFCVCTALRGSHSGNFLTQSILTNLSCLSFGAALLLVCAGLLVGLLGSFISLRKYETRL